MCSEVGSQEKQHGLDGALTLGHTSRDKGSEDG